MVRSYTSRKGRSSGSRLKGRRAFAVYPSSPGLVLHVETCKSACCRGDLWDMFLLIPWSHPIVTGGKTKWQSAVFPRQQPFCPKAPKVTMSEFTHPMTGLGSSLPRSGNRHVQRLL